ncbi:hypothetical protein CYMTET_21572 [Cymbomonas tetramitiformis]|uniref:Right handed beta helix domain-containing protein n=1 Tax=Cymbomonas tetramitiformis TaxID=36881 RepID=A0AAE0G1X4_9CHLO|nr:hypothetical protein CYMTET_21572 [Cymbomonas tetramitiformis]
MVAADIPASEEYAGFQTTLPGFLEQRHADINKTRAVTRRKLGEGPALFFSGYAEGSSNNKLVVLFNPSCDDAPLEQYSLVKTTNGREEETVQLSGTLNAGELLTLCYTPYTGFCELSYSLLNHNGDDAIALVHDGVLLDTIGVLGEDPGSGWEVAGVPACTKDHTLVRKSSVATGQPDWGVSAGTTATDSEWIVYSKDELQWLECFTTTQSCTAPDVEIEICTGYSPPISTPSEAAEELAAYMREPQILTIMIAMDVLLASTLPNVSGVLRLVGVGDGHPAISGGYHTTLLRVTGRGNLTVETLALVNGYGGQGGAVEVHAGARLLLQGCTVAHHRALGAGGAVYVEAGAPVDVTLADSLLLNNTAAEGGGLLHVPDLGGGQVILRGSRVHGSDGNHSQLSLSGCGAVLVSACSLANNTAVSSGALLLWMECAERGSSLTMEDSVADFHASLMGYGGVLNLQGMEALAVSLARSSFQGNTATVSGGVLGAFGCSSLVVALQDVLMENNTALSKGGALQLNGDQDAVRASLSVTGSMLRGNCAAAGGAMWLYRVNDVEMAGSLLEANNATEGDEEGGGALCMKMSRTLRMYGGTQLEGNTAVIGGAVYLDEIEVVDVAETRLVRNSATQEGGALYVKDTTGEFRMTDCEARQNEGGWGGAAYILLYTGTFRLLRSSFHGNTAFGCTAFGCPHQDKKGQGGAVLASYSRGSSLSISEALVEECVFHDNAVNSYGSALLIVVRCPSPGLHPPSPSGPLQSWHPSISPSVQPAEFVHHVTSGCNAAGYA